MIAVDHPGALFAAPVAALFIVLLAVWVRSTRVKRASQWSPALGAKAANHGKWSVLLLACAILGAFAALAGPRWGTRIVETDTKGLDLVIAIDISRSMLAEDVEPSRLTRAKREARRLIHDLGGDRIGLVAFASEAHTMSPLTVDGSALNLLVDALDPDIVSSGGSEFAVALRRGHELLLAGDEVADRVLVMFTDGEAHDSIADIVARAERLRRDGVHLVLVAEGGRTPVRIPVRDFDGLLVGHQLDPGGEYVETRRRDDILTDVADAAQGVLVSAEVGDQAGRVRELINAYKRMPRATTTAAQDVSRAWIPILLALGCLFLHTLMRKTAALAVLILSIALCQPTEGQSPRNHAEDAFLDGRFDRAAALYRMEVMAGQGGDTAWFNLGTAALASGDTILARSALGFASESVEPAIRFGARYNLGLLELRLASVDTANLVPHLEAAQEHYREALLLRPSDEAAKWNMELAVLLMPEAEDSAPGNQQNQGADQDDSPGQEPQGLSAAQAEQILNSIAEEERRTLLRRNQNRRRLADARGRREW